MQEKRPTIKYSVMYKRIMLKKFQPNKKTQSTGTMIAKSKNNAEYDLKFWIFINFIFILIFLWLSQSRKNSNLSPVDYLKK